MAKTRGRPAAKATVAVVDPSETTKSVGPKTQLNPEETSPPRVFITPENLSTEARIVTLENPRFAKPDRYLVCPERGFHEFKRIAAPKSTPRSWLLVSDDDAAASTTEDTIKDEGKSKEADSTSRDGYVVKAPDLFVATPIDSLFMILPALAPPPPPKNSATPKRLFLSSDDYVDTLASISPHLRKFLGTGKLRVQLERRMAAVCDTVEAGDESMFRLNEDKLCGELLRKAKKMAGYELPASMEEKLIRKALEAPVLSIKRDESAVGGSQDVHSTQPASEISTPQTESQDSQATDLTSDTTATSLSEDSTAATSVSDDQSEAAKDGKTTPQPIDAPGGVAELLRLRTAFFVICSNYLAPHLSDMLKNTILSPSSPIDFKPLDTHIAHLTKLRQDALAARSLGDYSRKRAMVGDDEELEARAEKKRKQDEEDKRKKAGESRGVKNLKKVNTTGMKKMSDFFKKK
ncbi:ribonuclease subunit B protein [Rutstroemia sp. NJR-2017a WRK4]|nr:ribonuclease subunit B protein [Rutstroemia sp. NJR-2017a WRK4]PQE14848.1 ribonuclease subunit B protein [Rutstroemia sp. NJR-2017a WRK4]